MNLQKYFADLERDVLEVYKVAEEARSKGLDPKDRVEIPLAKTLAKKCVSLVATRYPQVDNEKIIKRILDLEKKYGKLDVAVSFTIAEEVAKEKYCEFASKLEAIDAGIKVGFAYNTLGVVSPPVEGFTDLKLGKTRDGKEYFKAYFSGPIRAAGTTATCLVLFLIDYLRELFGYAKYDPSEEEVKRYITEIFDYHERITNLQYIGTEEEVEFLARNIPIEISGEPTESREVSNYKNLPRVETNFIRGGMCLCFSEGLAQKAKKGYRLLGGAKEKGIKTTGFDFIPEYLELVDQREKGKTDGTPTYIKDLVAGRPVFGHPSRSGAFRARYGRSRTSGFSANAVHPATMAITDNFIATGTQLKTEKPTKGCVVTSCDSIDGPIVKLYNGSVKYISSPLEAKKIYKDVEEIIYLGDMLIPFSDVANRNFKLLKPGYVEEWWKLDVEVEDKSLLKDVNVLDVNFNTAVEISEKVSVPLHPAHIFYWSQINKKQFYGIIEWLRKARIRGGKIIFPYTKPEQEIYSLGKRGLELLGIEHEVTIENVVVGKEKSKALLSNLGLDWKLVENNKEEDILLSNYVMKDIFDLETEDVLEIIQAVSSFGIKDKAGDFIGSRMGRPEKAKLRKLTGSPNVLFPVGKEGGRLRSIQAAVEEGKIYSSFPIYHCAKCKKESIYPSCEECGEKNDKMFYCRECKEKTQKPCKEHESVTSFANENLDIGYYYEKARTRLGIRRENMPLLIKAVRGTSNDTHSTEHLAKGILRALHGIQVNKDGTIRYDAIETPITHFKPCEVGVGVEKLRELGYEKDINEKPLENESQILELMPHDIFLPCCDISKEEKADDVFIKTCQFIDDLLVKFYKLKPFYNVKKREDLIGQLGIVMAPHNVAGVVSRFIGFTNTLGLYASPYIHAAVRRDCDGDEASIMLLGDVLMNFSKEFLPSHRGGTQDAPLVLNVRIDAGEVDDQILDFEVVPDNTYPLELYQLAEQGKHSSEVKGITMIKDILREGKNPFTKIGFTHDTNNFNEGVACSSYKLLATMQEKVQHQMALVERLRAVDTADTARLILERHFIRDMKGNLRKFSMQSFRCVACNEIVRRPPLEGVCPKCKGKIIFTIHEGGIKKYLNHAIELAEKYDLTTYMKQNIEIIKENIDSIFGKELEKQEALGKWF